jgi:hypothetical protein
VADKLFVLAGGSVQERPVAEIALVPAAEEPQSPAVASAAPLGAAP